jgi:tetratricopeptide (TPR) repeat protein
MDVPATLNAIDAHIRAGDEQRAKDGLAEVVKAAAAQASFDRVIALCMTLNAPDFVDAFLEHSTGESDPAKRMKLELRVVDFQIGKRMRSEAFRRLQKLVDALRDQSDDLRNVAERLSKIGEDTLAAELFNRILKSNPGDIAVERGLIRSMIMSRREGGIEKLESFLKRKDVSAVDWQEAAEMLQHIGRVEQSIKCSRTALSLGGNVAGNRISIAGSLIRLNKRSQAASEMAKIPLDKIAEPWKLRELARSAYSCGDPALAARIAEEQWLRNKESSPETLFFIDYLILSKNLSRAKSVLDHLFTILESKAKLSAKEFPRLIDICFNIFHSSELERRAIEIGLKQYPGDETLTAAKARRDARQSFMANHAAHPVAPETSTGLLGRLRRRLTGGGERPA